MRLIDQDNNQVGVVGLTEAKSLAKDAGLDLVEISPNSEPPVCRIMDFGKFLYEQKRKDKQANKKQHIVSLKEIRLRPKIDKHDLMIKVDHARKFIEKGHKVQFTMLFRGREMLHVDIGRALMDSVVEGMEDIAKVDRNTAMHGKRMTIVLTGNK